MSTSEAIFTLKSIFFRPPYSLLLTNSKEVLETDSLNGKKINIDAFVAVKNQIWTILIFIWYWYSMVQGII